MAISLSRVARWLALSSLLSTFGAAHAQLISLPDLLALEAPPQTESLALDDVRVTQLLVDRASAGVGTLRISVEGSSNALTIGPNRVTWTAEDPPGNVIATRTDYVYLLHHGQTPVATTRGPVENGPGYATAGNHGANVVRDGTGAIHAAWRDSAPAVMYRRGRQDPVTGVITWSGPAIDISAGTAVERSYVALAVSPGAVHFAWSGSGGQIRYRRLRLLRNATATDWVFDAVRNTGAFGSAPDNGPDVGVFGDDEVHLISPSMGYAYSLDGGSTWQTEDLQSELPAGLQGYKYPALAVDHRGHVHFLVTIRRRNNYWPLWYMHRDRPTATGAGAWLEAHDPFAGHTAWQDPGAGEPALLLDWVDIEADALGGLHIGWHGTFASGAFAEDDAFYATRDHADDGDAGAWQDPVILGSHAPGTFFLSFTPSIVTDSITDTTLTAIMVKALGTPPVDNYDDLDSALRVLRAGTLVDEQLRGNSTYVKLSDAAHWPMATWWPSAAPRLYRHPTGRVWIDILQSMLHNATSEDFALVVHQRFEITDVVREQIDSDLDGVLDGDDAFPLDPDESVDTDNDGIGNNADADDDNDGVADVNDPFPLDPTRPGDVDSGADQSSEATSIDGPTAALLLILLALVLRSDRAENKSQPCIVHRHRCREAAHLDS